MKASGLVQAQIWRAGVYRMRDITSDKSTAVKVPKHLNALSWTQYLLPLALYKHSGAPLVRKKVTDYIK